MPKEVFYEQYASQFLTQLPRGAFLTVKDQERLNTMTIGWGSIGHIWQRPVIMVMVRQTRYTYQLMEASSDFSVSLPVQGELKSDLAMAGTKSGRDIDKFSECRLTAQNARTISSPIIGECGLVFECQTLFKQLMDAEQLNPEIRTKFYGNGDYHVLYFGEITACYTIDQ